MRGGGAGGPARALDRRAGPELIAAWPTPDRLAGRARLAGDRYSRRVALLKRLLPAVGVTLLVLVALWPRLGPLLDSVRLGFPAIDLREAHELRMVNPRYAGIDRFNRPYVVTSAIGRQVPSRDDLMSLERPKAEMTMHRGASVVVTAATAMYQSQAQLLDLFDDVNLFHENGTRFVTRTAHVDVSANTAEGHDPVVGHGPSGDIAAQGFRILEKGDTIIFTGSTNLRLKGTKPSVNPATPAALPAEVEAAAARIEAAATAPTTVAPEAPTPANVVAEPATAEPTMTPAAAKSQGGAKRDAKLPRSGAPAGAKARWDAS
jgi:lipopolysaccharide export system protein LptC